MGPNRVRTSMKRGTPSMTHNFWAYDTVESDPHTIAIIVIIVSVRKIRELSLITNLVRFRSNKNFANFVYGSY